MNTQYMRTIVHQFGSAKDVVKTEMIAPNELNAGEVHIEMQCAPINPSDIVTISGAYRGRTNVPMVPGFEGVGTVVKKANDVVKLELGDLIAPIRQAGTWQDIQTVPASNCFKIDKNLKIEDAATCYINPMTAIKMVETVAKVAKGMAIVVNAANSEIGRIIIQLCLIKGARITALIRSEHSATALAQKFGNKLKIIHQDDIARLQETGPQDVLFDAVGGPKAEQHSSTLKYGGMIVHYGLLSGTPISPNLKVERPDINLQLYWLRNWIHSAPHEDIQALFDRVATLFHDGFISTRVHNSYPLADITLALNELENKDRVGKILLRPNA